MRLLATFLLFLYKCRVLAPFSPKQAKKEIKNALEIFQREIRKHSEEGVAHAYMCLHNLLPVTVSHDSFVAMAAAAVSAGGGSGERLSIMDRLNQMALYLKVGLASYWAGEVVIMTADAKCCAVHVHLCW